MTTTSDTSGAREDLSGTIKAKKPLSSEDRVRMRRLSEEIDGRLEEMRLIIERTLEIKLNESSVKIRTRDIAKLAETIGAKAEGAAASQYDHCFCSHTNGCGCY